MQPQPLSSPLSGVPLVLLPPDYDAVTAAILKRFAA